MIRWVSSLHTTKTKKIKKIKKKIKFKDNLFNLDYWLKVHWIGFIMTSLFRQFNDLMISVIFVFSVELKFQNEFNRLKQHCRYYCIGWDWPVRWRGAWFFRTFDFRWGRWWPCRGRGRSTRPWGCRPEDRAASATKVRSKCEKTRPSIASRALSRFCNHRND